MGIMSSELNPSNPNVTGFGGGYSIPITSKDISLMMYLLGQDATLDVELLV